MPNQDINHQDVEDVITAVSIDMLSQELKTAARDEDLKMVNEGKVDVGIDLHIKQSIFSAAFPLHEVIFWQYFLRFIQESICRYHKQISISYLVIGKMVFCS